MYIFTSKCGADFIRDENPELLSDICYWKSNSKESLMTQKNIKTGEETITEKKTLCSCFATLLEENGVPRVNINCDAPASKLKFSAEVEPTLVSTVICEIRFMDPDQIGDEMIKKFIDALKPITVGTLDTNIKKELV